MKYGHAFGLIQDELFRRLGTKEVLIKEGVSFLVNCGISPNEINYYLESKFTSPLTQKEKLSELVKRPEVKLNELFKLEPVRKEGLCSTPSRSNQ